MKLMNMNRNDINYDFTSHYNTYYYCCSHRDTGSNFFLRIINTIFKGEKKNIWDIRKWHMKLNDGSCNDIMILHY